MLDDHPYPFYITPGRRLVPVIQWQKSDVQTYESLKGTRESRFVDVTRTYFHLGLFT